MITPVARLLGALALALSAAHAQGGQPTEWNPTVQELMRLPVYCRAQFDHDFAKRAKAPMPMALCGVYMNHYCPGLVALNRATSVSLPMSYRRDMLNMAMVHLDYTKKRIQPNCSFRNDFEAAYARAEVISKFKLLK